MQSYWWRFWYLGNNCDDDDYDDDDDVDDGYPAYSNQSYSHQAGICHNDEVWEYDPVKFPQNS